MGVPEKVGDENEFENQNILIKNHAQLLRITAHDHLAVEFFDDAMHLASGLIVFERVVDFGAGNPVGGHALSPKWWLQQSVAAASSQLPPAKPGA